MVIDGFKHIIMGEDYKVNDYITIHNPTLREVYEFGIAKFNTSVFQFVRRPYDMMVELDDIGIDYSTVSDYELFTTFIPHVPKEYSSILFPNIDFTDYVACVRNDDGRIVLYNTKLNIQIDEAIYWQIVRYLRYVNYLSEKVEYDMGNKRGREFLIDRVRRKQKDRGKIIQEGIDNSLEYIVSYLVNHNGFKYNYETVMDMKYCQVLDAYYRLSHVNNIDNTMYGIYSGCVDVKKINNKETELNPVSNLHK